MASNSSFAAQLRAMKDEIRRLKIAIPLQNSSVTKGMLRFIGGVLRLEAGALLEGIGTFRWTGRGSIAGDWEVLEGGVIRVGGVLISPVGGGRIMVGQGPVGIILDGGSGSLTMGNVRIEAGKVYVGDMILDPAVAGGALTYPNGSRLEADADNAGARLIAGDAVVRVGLVASLRKAASSVIVSALGITLNAASGTDIEMLGRIRVDRASMPTVVDPNVPEGTPRILASGVVARTVLAA